jgi:hypothetical protein
VDQDNTTATIITIIMYQNQYKQITKVRQQIYGINRGKLTEPSLAINKGKLTEPSLAINLTKKEHVCFK